MQFQLTSVPQTLLLPLYGRARHTREENPVLRDENAVAIIDRLDYDFAPLERVYSPLSGIMWAARAKQFDALLERYIAGHPECTVVNLGAGLDTTFNRVDNGSINWIDLDLPEVIEIRNALIPETERTRCIARSVFDPSWTGELGDTGKGLYMVSAGCFFYFEEAQVRELFAMLHERLPGVRMAFDAMTEESAARANDMISNAEMKRAVIQWFVHDAHVIDNWNCGVSILQQIPLFRDIPREGISPYNAAVMNHIDQFGMITLVECEL